jgi:hypothetical protein
MTSRESAGTSPTASGSQRRRECFGKFDEVSIQPFHLHPLNRVADLWEKFPAGLFGMVAALPQCFEPSAGKSRIAEPAGIAKARRQWPTNS